VIDEQKSKEDSEDGLKKQLQEQINARQRRRNTRSFSTPFVEQIIPRMVQTKMTLYEISEEEKEQRDKSKKDKCSQDSPAEVVPN